MKKDKLETDELLNRFGIGVRVDARYLPQTISGYAGNPLIAALPPILTTEDVAACLADYPVYDEGLRKEPAGRRIHIVADCLLNFFAPLDIHIDLEQRFSCLIRSGYKARNPMLTNQSLAVQHRLENLNLNWVSQYPNRSAYRPTTAIGFNIIGISGVGKSQIVERITSLYPQVIDHREFNGISLCESQLVYVNLDCPFDSSLKWLCVNFFNKVDAALGTPYTKNHASGRRTVDEMLQKMALVAANHHLGVLVIDEIGRLREANIGVAQRVLDFCVQLVNTMGVPIVLVGNYKALEVLGGDFSQLRRGAGQGDLIWKQMEFDSQWEGFLEVLWKFQLTRHRSPLTPAISRLMYELTQGITDLVIKTYMLAQQFAIQTGIEKIDEDVIVSAYESKFQILQPALRALRTGKKEDLKKYEDVYHRMLDEHAQVEPVSSVFAQPDGSSGPEPPANEPLQPASEVATTEKTVRKPSRTPPSKPRSLKESVKKGLLPQIGAKVGRNLDQRKSSTGDQNEVYDALLADGHIHQADNFLSADNS